MHNAHLSYSFIAEHYIDPKTFLVRPVQNKSNGIFKVDSRANKSMQETTNKNKKPIIKNALSQTIVTFPSDRYRPKKVEDIPPSKKIDIPDKEEGK